MPLVEKLTKVRSCFSLLSEARDQALQTVVVPVRVRSAREQSPSGVECEEVQAVCLAVGADLLDLAPLDHRSHLGPTAADLAWQPHRDSHIL